jgi:thioredoxin 1
MKKILYFSAPWCLPCKQFGPVMEQMGQSIPVQKINVDDQPDLATAYSVRNVPTVIIVKDGEIVNRMVGVQTPATVMNAYNNA